MKGIDMNQEAIWDFFQNEGVASFGESYGRLRFLTNKFTKKERVLNIGVGAGFFEQLAKEKGIDIYCIDPSEKAIDKLKNTIGDERAIVGYSQDMKFPDCYFDGVVMSEVLEHLDSDVIERTLKEVKRILKPQGIFIGTVPFNENLTEYQVVCPCCSEKFHRWGHLQSFTFEKLGSLFNVAELNVELKLKLFTTWKSLNWKGKLSAFVNSLFFKIGFKKSGLNIYFEATKSQIK
jgi:ubiquinone/menaquinone biosynthesis C-methylase UbiE